jgi:hypothetical protein
MVLRILFLFFSAHSKILCGEVDSVLFMKLKVIRRKDIKTTVEKNLLKVKKRVIALEGKRVVLPDKLNFKSNKIFKPQKMETPNHESKSKKGTLWLILLLLSVVLNIYQWRNHSTSVNMYEQKVDTLVVERVNVEKELSETRSELEKYRGISANLDSLLNEAQAKIDEQSKKINSLTKNEKNLKALNEQLRQQLADLQILRDEYLGRIDSLLMVNKQLVAEKEQLTGQNISLSKNLETTVATASVLKAEYIKAKSFKRKGSGKYVETALAKRTHKLDICFDILDNKISKQGEKTVYLKITEPGGKPIGNRSTGSSSFTSASGEEIMYASSSNITFTGAKQNLCMSYEEQEDKKFAPGTYLLEVYIDGNLSGAGSCVLR